MAEAGCLTLSSKDLKEWADKLKKGTTKPMTREEGAALVMEIVRLRKTVKRMEEQVLAATQVPMFPDLPRNKREDSC